MVNKKRRRSVSGILEQSDQLHRRKDKKRRLKAKTNNELSADERWRAGVTLREKFAKSGKVTDIDRALVMMEGAIAAVPQDHANLASWLNDLGNSFQDRFEHTEDLADLERGISTLERAIELKPEDQADLPSWLNNLAVSFQRRFDLTGESTDIDCAVSSHERAVDLTPEDNADLALWLNDLGNALRIRFQYMGHIKDIERAISSLERAVELTPENDAGLSLGFSNLGMSFQCRSEHTGDIEDIERAIFHLQRAVELTPEDDADLASLFSSLGRSFRSRFEHTRNVEDIVRTISNLQRAVNLTPEDDAGFPSSLSSLGMTLLDRFEHVGDLADIERAILLLARTVDLTPEDHADLATALHNLGVSLHSRFERTGNIEDIERAISNLQRAVNLTPEDDADLASRLSSLGMSFESSFLRTGSVEDNERAISNLQRAVNLAPEDDAELASWLNNLGNALRSRFERRGNIEDIEYAISNLQRAVRLTPEGHVYYHLPSRLSNLGMSFLCRGDHTGNLADVEHAISNLQRAVDLTPEDHADLALWLSNLGASLINHFERTRDLSDVERAVSNLQRAICLRPEGHVSLPLYLSNLGMSFKYRFEHAEDPPDPADLKRAISNLQTAVNLTPENDANLASWLNNLGMTFQISYQLTGHIKDIKHARSNFQRAVNLLPEGHVNLPLCLNNLGMSFLDFFERTEDLTHVKHSLSNIQRTVNLTPKGHVYLPSVRPNRLGRSHSQYTEDIADVDRAISNLQRSVQLTPEGHANMTLWLINLGISFQHRFKHTNRTEDLGHAMSVYRSSATQVSGPPSIRFIAARDWALVSRQLGHTSDNLQAFHVAIALLSQVAGLEQTIHKRRVSLVEVSNVTASAAATAINAEQVETALTWLEQGRCLVWNQIKQLRTPVSDALGTHNPSLADRFVRVARDLENAGSRRQIFDTSSEANMKYMIAMQDETQKHVELAKEWTEILEQIRMLPDFHDFLQPPRASDLLNGLPHDGPPLHIPLEKFSYQQAIKLRDKLHTYLREIGVVRIQEVDFRGGGPFPTVKVQKEAIIHQVLRELWEGVVKPVLDVLAYSSRNEQRPRIWWCPTGPLAFLPIHAAGIYSREGPCISDFVVSSYIPSISVLLDKVKLASTARRTPSSLLLISQPYTPGKLPIPATQDETRMLRDMMRDEHVETLLLEDAIATKTRVTMGMETHSWVHFACHAIQDQRDPLKSGLELHDGRLELLQMMKQQIPNADHAFLSACQTSTGDKTLSDEVIHLAAGMLTAGYRGVVGTMWSIKDLYGPDIANSFYRHVLETGSEADHGRLDSSHAAFALDKSIREIRERLGDTEMALLTWVPYVHFGF